MTFFWINLRKSASSVDINTPPGGVIAIVLNDPQISQIYADEIQIRIMDWLKKVAIDRDSIGRINHESPLSVTGKTRLLALVTHLLQDIAD